MEGIYQQPKKPSKTPTPQKGRQTPTPRGEDLLPEKTIAKKKKPPYLNDIPFHEQVRGTIKFM